MSNKLDGHEDIFDPRFSAKETLKRLPVINDPIITEAMAALFEDVNNQDEGGTMKPEQRALIELQAWVDARAEGMSINYGAHNPTVIGGIPHWWSVQIGRTDREHYSGYGVTMEQAIVACYQAWQNR